MSRYQEPYQSNSKKRISVYFLALKELYQRGPCDIFRSDGVRLLDDDGDIIEKSKCISLVLSSVKTFEAMGVQLLDDKNLKHIP